ncbi:MAG: DUF3662 domain-containing protein [Chloroflexi bacterium]|nr:DUF3662 domain-containing protein [Chloroflexota bacterium]
MTRPFAALERFFERLFERPAARLFGAPLQPVQLQRRLERAMEADRRLSADRTYVPNRYRVLLNPRDLAAFHSYQASLESDLADALLARARNRGYTLLERPVVILAASPKVAARDVEIRAELLDPEALRPGGATVFDDGAHHDAVVGPRGSPPAMSRTQVFAIPDVRAPALVLEVRSPKQPAERRALHSGNVRIGRAADNDLVLGDDRVSRHHGQLVARQGALIYTDLGSTNGSYLNGAPVTEIALGPGDVLQLGDSTLSIDPAR